MPTKALIKTGVVAVVVYAFGFALVALALEMSK